MREMPRAFELYKHFKGNLYQVMAIATDSEDGSQKVVYQALYGDYRIYVRDLQSFMSHTDKEKYPDADQEYRFELVTKERKPACESGEPMHVIATDHKMEENSEEPVQSVMTQNQTVMAQEEFVRDQNQTVMAQEEAEREQNQSVMTQEEAMGLDPAVAAYLDVTGYEERLNILTSVHHRITDEMLDTMAVVSDIELEEGSVEDKYQSLKNCLLTKQKFEILRHS